MLLGSASLEKLRRSRVAVFGLGGVGGHAAEALARAGIGTLHLVDGDAVAESNINRQIVALHSTIGQNKADVMGARALDINPGAHVYTYPIFYTAETKSAIDFSQLDYVLDAVDMVAAKVDLAVTCKEHGVPLISCMGAGNKLDPTRFEVADIFETSVCPLARILRREFKARDIPALKVVYSKENPITPAERPDDTAPGKYVKRQSPGSISFVPSVAGLIMAGEAIKDLALLK